MLFIREMRSENGRCHGSRQTIRGLHDEDSGALCHHQVQLSTLISFISSLMFASVSVCMCVSGSIHFMAACIRDD